MLVLLALLEPAALGQGIGRDERTVRVGELVGFGVDVDVTTWPDGHRDAALHLERLPLKPLALERGDVAHADPAGLIARLENRLFKLEETAAACRSEAQASRAESTEIAGRLGRAFDDQGRLETLRARLVDIDNVLTPTDPTAAPGHSGPPADAHRHPTAAENVARVEANRLSRPEDGARASSAITDDSIDRPPAPSGHGDLPEASPGDQLRPADDGNTGHIQPEGTTGQPVTRGQAAMSTTTTAVSETQTPARASPVGSSSATQSCRAPAPAVPSIHRRHELHQQLYPGMQSPRPVIQP
jgi:hypothetical protein